MSFEILKNNPALIRDGKRLNELIENYEQQKSELIKLGELISEQTSFKSQYIFADDAFNINGCRIFFNRFYSESINNILKHNLYYEGGNIVSVYDDFDNFEFLLYEHQFLKLFEIEE